MQAVRQAASGLIYGMVSLLLVLGSLSLALAQGGVPGVPPATFTPLPSSTWTPKPSPAATDGNSAIPTQGETAIPTQGLTPSATRPAASQTEIIPTAAKAAATATYRATCVVPYGWVKAYVVQPGDTLFRIATLYGVSVDALRGANCRSSTLIFVGEMLRVPYGQPAATQLTIIPTFPTPTEPAATESPAPSETESTPDP